MAWLPFTASRVQVATYLLGVALFSISFLVFLNSSVSFVITDLIGQKHSVGNAVGTLGFADELLALVACPLWGLLSDRIGVRHVTFLGYAIIAAALCVFVQARHVYPDLLLARLLFALGGAACSTMVTAILPTMTLSHGSQAHHDSLTDRHARRTSISTSGTDATLTPVAYRGRRTTHPTVPKAGGGPSTGATSQVAGLVGMFTGIGALVALGLFLPLPVTLRGAAGSPAAAVTYSFYVVAAVAFVVALACLVGLRNLPGEEHKGYAQILTLARSHVADPPSPAAEATKAIPYFRLAFQALKLGVTDLDIGLGYLGGFVARASSVAISLFIPLYVNAYFIQSGLCKDDPGAAPSDIKRQCERAYKLASALTGVSQLVALLCAPLFGYADSKLRRFNAPLLAAALVGVIGYVLLGRLTPDPKATDGGPVVFVVMALLGVSQIGAIVCSLSILGRGIQSSDNSPPAYIEQRSAPDSHSQQRGQSLPAEDDGNEGETAPLLLNPQAPDAAAEPLVGTRNHLKGSIAGVYSLTGGAGILILTKLGGYLFDEASHGAPFFMMAAANGLLFVVALACTLVTQFGRPAHTVPAPLR